MTVTVNSKAAAILQKAVENNGKDVNVRFPLDLYLKTLKRQGRMIEEAAENGSIANISVHSIIIDAVRSYLAA
jgi:hypothetical protein